jgi:hypothetical protein
MRIDSVVIPALRAVASRPRLTALIFARDPWGNPFSAENVSDSSSGTSRLESRCCERLAPAVAGPRVPNSHRSRQESPT